MEAFNCKNNDTYVVCDEVEKKYEHEHILNLEVQHDKDEEIMNLTTERWIENKLSAPMFHLHYRLCSHQNIRYSGNNWHRRFLEEWISVHLHVKFAGCNSVHFSFNLRENLIILKPDLGPNYHKRHLCVCERLKISTNCSATSFASCFIFIGFRL